MPPLRLPLQQYPGQEEVRGRAATQLLPTKGACGPQLAAAAGLQHALPPNQ